MHRLGILSICALLAATLVVVPTYPAQAQNQQPPAEEVDIDPEPSPAPAVTPAADWVPFTGSYAVGCTRTSTKNPGCPVHHPTWAIDWATPTGTKIRAAGAGTVVGLYRGCLPNGGDGECNGGAGNLVVVEHGDYFSRYLHLASIPNRIKVGYEVAPGEVVGRSGASGTFGGAHLHYDEYQPGPPAGRVAFGSMYACHDRVAVLYPQVLGYSSWDLVPPGSTVRNDGYDCIGHPPLPHPPAPEPPIYPKGPKLAIGGGTGIALGDFDNDGRPELAVGAPGGRPGGGSRSGLVAIVEPTDPGGGSLLSQGSTMAGLKESGDRVGAAVAAGDFDCDGKDDLAVGAPGEDLDALFIDAGAVNVVFGKGDEQLLFAGQGIDAYYRRPSDWLGAALARGDFNNDGCDDLAIAAPGADRSGGLNMGLIWVMFGSPSGLRSPYRLLQGINLGGVLENGDYTGSTLAAGDLNCDGFDDLAVGVPTEVIDGESVGAVMVVLGKRSGFRGGRALFQGNGLAGEPAAGELTGASLAIGDLDADGCDDLVVGSPGTTVSGKANAGSVLVSFGNSAGVHKGTRQLELSAGSGLRKNPRKGDKAGSAVAVGDINCDGFDDLAVGAPGRNIKGKKDAGVVYTVRGRATGLRSTADLLRQGTKLRGKLRAGAKVGAGIAIGQIDGRRCADLAISAPGTKVGGKDHAGAVLVAFGAKKAKNAGQPLRITQKVNAPGKAVRYAAFGGSSGLVLLRRALSSQS